MKRKLTVLPVCMSFLLLAGCTSQIENEWEEKGRGIRFSLPSLTRTIINDVADLEQEGYAVWGHATSHADWKSTLLFNHEAITYNAGKWDYATDERYWYTGNTYHFHALYPQPDALNPAIVTYDYTQNPSGNLSITGFNAAQPTDGTAMTDLLLASSTDINVGSTQDIPPYVSLSFRHLLTRVRFLGYTSDRYLGNGRELKIKSFSISGIAAAGSWNGSRWTTSGESAIYTAHIAADGLTLGNTPTDMFGEDVMLLLIPQSFTDLKVSLTYEYTSGSLGTQTATSTLQGTWEPGKSYSYKFSINSEIFFETPQVDDWSDMPVYNNGANIDVTK